MTKTNTRTTIVEHATEISVPYIPKSKPTAWLDMEIERIQALRNNNQPQYSVSKKGHSTITLKPSKVAVIHGGSAKGFDWEVRVGCRHLDEGYVVDTNSITKLFQSMEKTVGKTPQTCEVIASHTVRYILKTHGENRIELVYVRLSPDADTSIELLWHRGQPWPAEELALKGAKNA